MDRYDVKLPAPGSGEDLPVTETGDLMLTRGLGSLRDWAERAFVVAPGQLLHRPAFGAGGERYLGQGVGARPRLQRDFKATLLRDRRVRAARVDVTGADDAPHRTAVRAQITTVDGSVDEIAIGE